MRGRLAIGLASALALVAPTAARAESIVYVKDGDLWLTNIERSVQITSNGGYESPSQDGQGRIVAVRRVEEGEYTNRYLYRFDNQGNQLNERVTAVDVNNRLEIGPLGAEVSPNGDLVAYHYFNHSPTIPQNERPRFSMSYSNRNTDQTEIIEQGYYLNPTWIDNSNVALFVDPAFNTDLQIYTVGGSFMDWFAFEPADLTSGDLSADGKRFAAIADGGGKMFFFSLEAPPPAPPTPRCEASTPNGQYASVTWSPDGTEVAWQEADGIHLATVGDLATCQISEAATVPGGQAPFWGSGDMPPAGVDPTPNPGECRASIPRRVTRRMARRAIKVGINCPGAESARGSGRAAGKTVVKGRQTLNAGKGTLALKPTRAGKRILRTAKSVRVKVSVGGEAFGRAVKIGS